MPKQADRKPARKTTAKDAARPRTSAEALQGEPAVLAKIAAMPAPFCAMGERLHALIARSAPALQPTLWYGMPAYAKKGGVVCFFRADRYMTFGLTEKANFEREVGVPHQLLGSAWYFSGLDEATEARLSAIVRAAAGGD